MSEQAKKRPWFQYHLSTAVVLMFVAAGLLWLNLCYPKLPLPPYDELELTRQQCGWPIRIYDWTAVPTTMLSPTIYWYVNWTHLLTDATIALAVLLATAVICEMRIRRQERAND